MGVDDTVAGGRGSLSDAEGDDEMLATEANDDDDGLNTTYTTSGLENVVRAMMESGDGEDDDDEWEDVDGDDDDAEIISLSTESESEEDGGDDDADQDAASSSPGGSENDGNEDDDVLYTLN